MFESTSQKRKFSQRCSFWSPIILSLRKPSACIAASICLLVPIFMPAAASDVSVLSRSVSNVKPLSMSWDAHFPSPCFPSHSESAWTVWWEGKWYMMWSLCERWGREIVWMKKNSCLFVCSCVYELWYQIEIIIVCKCNLANANWKKTCKW